MWHIILKFLNSLLMQCSFRKRFLKIYIFMVSVFILLSNAHASNIIRDAEIEAVIQDIMQPLLKQINKTNEEISVYIVADPQINAYVQGGQNIFINTGLLIALQDQAQLAAVLAHELGHIVGGHLIKSHDAQSEAALNALITGAVVGTAATLSGGRGDAIASALIVGTQAGAGSIISFTRTQESAADQAAIRLLAQANINPNAMNQVLNMLAQNERGAQDYMRSHPLSRDRIEAINARLKHMPPIKSEKFIAPKYMIQYQRMQAKLFGFLENPENTLARYVQKNNFPPIVILIARASAYHRLGQFKNASSEIKKAQKLFPNDPYIGDLAGQIYLESGLPSKAANAYKTAYENSNRNPLIGLTYGQALVATTQKHNMQQAIKILKQSLLLEKIYARGYRDLSLAYGYLEQAGSAALASSEFFFLQGKIDLARNQAQKALLYFESNQPEALRARDILFFADKNNRRLYK